MGKLHTSEKWFLNDFDRLRVQKKLNILHWGVAFFLYLLIYLFYCYFIHFFFFSAAVYTSRRIYNYYYYFAQSFLLRNISIHRFAPFILFFSSLPLLSDIAIGERWSNNDSRFSVNAKTFSFFNNFNFSFTVWEFFFRVSFSVCDFFFTFVCFMKFLFFHLIIFPSRSFKEKKVLCERKKNVLLILEFFKSKLALD